jgi:hypothetical protein
MFIPGVAPPIFLLTKRNTSAEEEVAAANDFILNHPVFGFQSSPSDVAESKLAYVLTMIQLVSIPHHILHLSLYAHLLSSARPSSTILKDSSHGQMTFTVKYSRASPSQQRHFLNIAHSLSR